MIHLIIQLENDLVSKCQLLIKGVSIGIFSEIKHKKKGE